MIYTVSLQSKSLQQVDKKLDNIIRKQEQNELDFRRIKTKLKL